MIYFIYGQDTYRMRNKLAEIIEQYKKKNQNCFNLKFFEGEKLNYHELKEEFWQMSMFKEKKLVVLKNVFPNQEFKKLFSENSKKFIDSDDIIVFYEEAEISPKDSFKKLLIKEAKVQEFPLLKPGQLKSWALKELDGLGVKADGRAIEKLILCTGNDLWRLANEIKKIAAYKKSCREELTCQEIDLLVNPKIEADIFETIDAIAQKNKEKALVLLHKHLEKGDSPLYLLSMINFQFRNILAVKDLLEKGKLLSQIKLHPYVIRKSQQQARGFNLEELNKIYRKIFRADFSIKTGKIEAETALDLLVAEI